MTARRNGLGLITSSNFYVPQVNLPGSMASFVLPAGVPHATVATTSGGMGQTHTPYVMIGNPTVGTWSGTPLVSVTSGNCTPALLVLGALAAWFAMGGRV